MDAWKKWLIVLGGIVAVVVEFWPGYYLALIGGAVAAIIGLLLD